MQKRTLLLWLFVFALPMILTGCIGLGPPGSQKKVVQTVNILVFSDDNGNGKQDAGETPLPDTFVISESNIHGSYSRTGMLTGEDGKATVTVEYTHFFHIQLITPCGYRPTTPTKVEAKRNLSFGFMPQNPQTGTAELRFQLWQDTNQDNIRQAEEPSAGEGIWLYVIPELNKDYAGDIVTGALAVQTDIHGEVRTNLGNSCSEVTVLLKPDRSVGYFLANGNKAQLMLKYEVGLNEFELALYPKE